MRPLRAVACHLRELVRFTEKQYNDKALLHVVEYRDLKKVVQKTPVFAVLQHVFNHSTFHRGQLVTMMRVVGEPKIPKTISSSLCAQVGSSFRHSSLALLRMTQPDQALSNTTLKHRLRARPALRQHSRRQPWRYG
jgi:hypothetical protein